jgi:hypothetical protein
MAWERRTGHTEMQRKTYKISVRKQEVKTQLARPKRRWEDNIKINLRTIRFKVWIGFIWLRT